MKSKEEIEQLAENYVNHKPKNTQELRDVNLIKMGFKNGYTQCQEDMADKEYTKADLIWAIQEAYGHGQDDEFDGVNKVEESISAILKYLNKQD